MSDEKLARRTETQVIFNGVDITVYVNRDLISLTYTDNEEDEADDLQIKVLDREGNWLQKWLNTIVLNSSIGGELGKTPTKSSGTTYKVTSTTGVNVRSNASTKGKILGSLACNTTVTVNKISDGWAQIKYSGQTAWVKADCLTKVSSSEENGSWTIGANVVVTGTPQYSSYGQGKPGKPVTNYKGKISHLNLKDGIPYPISVDYLGWFAENQVQLTGEQNTQSGSSVSKAKGLKISAVIIRKNWNADGTDSVLDCGQFELDSIKVDGPPNTVTIKGTSLSYSSAIRQTKKSKSWDNVTLSQIVELIAKRSSTTYMYISSTNPKFDHVEQYCQSDIEFLSRLCHDAGASLKVSNNIIVVFDQSEFESKSEIMTIKFGDEGGYEKYSLSTNENDTYTSCRVYCTKPNGTVVLATAYVEDYKADDDNNQCLQICRNVSDQSEAIELAKQMLRLHNKYEYEASFTVPGNTSLTAGCVIALEDFGAWNGKYIIKQAKHTLGSSGYTTQINLRKVLPSSDTATARSSTNYDVDAIALQVIRGEWDVYPKRKELLEAAGYDYEVVQARVNEIIYG